MGVRLGKPIEKVIGLVSSAAGEVKETVLGAVKKVSRSRAKPAAPSGEGQASGDRAAPARKRASAGKAATKAKAAPAATPPKTPSAGAAKSRTAASRKAGAKAP